MILKASSRRGLVIDEGLQLLLVVMTLFLVVFLSYLKGGDGIDKQYRIGRLRIWLKVIRDFK
jgi:hypothetical protein